MLVCYDDLLNRFSFSKGTRVRFPYFPFRMTALILGSVGTTPTTSVERDMVGRNYLK